MVIIVFDVNVRLWRVRRSHELYVLREDSQLLPRTLDEQDSGGRVNANRALGAAHCYLSELVSNYGAQLREPGFRKGPELAEGHGTLLAEAEGGTWWSRG